MILNHIPLFQLTLLGGLNIPAPYYIDRDGRVWSNRTGSLVQLHGSKSGKYTYFKLGGGPYGNSHRHDQLFALAKRHPRWEIETAPEVAAWPTAKVTKEVVRGGLPVEDGVKAKGAIIGRVHKGHLVFGSEPKIHLSDKSVKDEMVRLATAYPGVKFVRLNIAETVVAGSVTWE
jgi:hypothetical protein